MARIANLAALAALLLVSAWRRFQLGDGSITDPYHQGEYFAALAALLQPKAAHFPIAIHGGLDYLPGWLVVALCGDDAHFLWSTIAYPLLSLAAAATFLAIAWRLTREAGDRWILRLATGFVAPVVVEYRDLGLLIPLAIYFWRKDAEAPRAALVLDVLLGVALGFGLLWSSDRGIAGAVSIGAALLFELRSGRGRAALAAFVISAVALFHVLPGHSLGSYVENTRVLITTASQWGWGWKPEAIGVIAFLGLAHLWALGLIAAEFRRSDARERATLFMLALLCLFFLRIGTNRADAHHLLMGLWMPLLVGIHWHGRHFAAPPSGVGMSATAALALAVLAPAYFFRIPEFVPMSALLLRPSVRAAFPRRGALVDAALVVAIAMPLAWAIPALKVGAREGAYDWLGPLRDPPPNARLVSDGIRWVAGELERARADCLFDLSNQGVINGVTRLPACTRFPYVVYATSRYEDELIEGLRQRRPPVIVYSARSWTHAIDGKPMPARYPRLHRFIDGHYHAERCKFGYCLRDLAITSVTGHSAAIGTMSLGQPGRGINRSTENQ